MASMIVVHGTGVRRASYDETFAVVQAKLHLARPNISAVECYWGDCGANLPKDPLCLPREMDLDGASSRGLGAARSELTAEQWAMLYDQPLLTFSGLPAEGRGRGEIVELSTHFRTVALSPALEASLKELGKVVDWQAARTAVLDSPEFADAVASVETTAMCVATAQAIVAELTRIALRDSRPVPDDEMRDEWVNLTATLLCPPDVGTFTTRGVAEIKQSIGGMFGWTAQWMAAGFAERKRLAEAESIAPVVGDIILYQSRGDAIRAKLVDAISNAPKPRFILAHSLGSVAAVDTAVLHKDLDIDQLFTIGSPAPVFYELGALVSLGREEKLPDHFPKWTNIFDPKDLISYIAHRTFHYDDRVKDVCHLSGQPLLAAHSAYWASRRSWEHLWKVLP